MQSNYKRLGDYIEVVNNRNTKLEVETLLGVSIKKVLMPSIANTIGTNMTTYKIINRNQFAYGSVTSRNGDKISIAILDEYDEAIVSQAYTVFKIIDTTQLNPEYLMMWFRRPEFDRYARFKSHGSARETFDWEEMLETELPVPSIETQQEIVKEYRTITNRIQLNEQLNIKLEETAQGLYKHWFVDFEFPDNDGKPYRSSGGSMVYNEELDREIPAGWEACSIKDFCSEMKSGATPSRAENSYWNKKDIPWIKTGELRNSVLIDAEEYISLEGLKNSSAKLLPKNTVLVAMYGQGNTKGQVGYLKIEASTNQACCSMICKNEEQASFLYYHLRVNQEEIVSVAIGGAQPNLSKEIIENVPILKPKLKLFDIHPFVQILGLKESTTREIKALNKLQTLLLSKMATLEEKPVLAYE